MVIVLLFLRLLMILTAYCQLSLLSVLSIFNMHQFWLRLNISKLSLLLLLLDI